MLPSSKFSLFGRSIVVLAAVAMVFLALRQHVQATGAPPLGTEDFRPFPTEGWGDRNNSWTWSMQWWQNQLFVGDNRSYGCVSSQAYHALNSIYPYPPGDPDMNCPSNPAKISMDAEIWTWFPTTNTWQMVYDSPYSVPNPLPGDAGLYLPPDIGFRTVTIYTDTVGTPHMVFGGVTAGAMGFGNLPPPRLLSTTDGVNFTPVPQDKGTFMGLLTQVSFRSMTDFNNQLFVINGNIQGAGPIIASLPGEDPLAGDNNWAQATPGGIDYYNMAVFNGYLYAGVVDSINGYSIVKTSATGSMPYTWTTVISNGGGLLPTPSQYPISMQIYDGRLYVGTVSPPELIRINPDDTWDLVVGTPRQYNGQWKYPLSGLGEQYDNNFNDHIWRLGTHGNSLFAGTYDTSVRYKYSPQYGQILPQMGFDLFRTDDGWRMTNVSTNGLNNGFDYGIRNFSDTPYGMFFGSANEYYGLTIYQGTDATSYRVPSPQRVDVEMSHNQPVLSWDPVPSAVSYHVYRATFTTVQISATVQLPGGNFTFPSTFQEITPPIKGIPDTVFVDQTVSTTLPTNMYYVTAEDGHSNVSDQSNLALAPSFWPPTTFTSLLNELASLQSRGRFVNSAAYSNAQAAVTAAESAVFPGNNLSSAFTQLQSLDSQVNAGSIAQSPDSTDLDIYIAQLERRLKLANAGLVDVSALQ
jgi:hypothetical protein